MRLTQAVPVLTDSASAMLYDRSGVQNEPRYVRGSRVRCTKLTNFHTADYHGRADNTGFRMLIGQSRSVVCFLERLMY